MALDTTIGGTSADSYGTLAEYQAYGTSMGWTLSGDDAADEVNLRRAAVVIDRQYSFRGYQQYETQARDWPRLDVGYVDGWYVDADTIPTDVKNAQFELAYLIQGGLDPFATINGAVKMTRAKAGPVETETEYAGSLGVPRIVAVEGLLGPYLSAGRGQVKLMRG